LNLRGPSMKLRYLVLTALVVGGCDVVEGQAVEAADFAGAKADAHCDRRVVTDGGTPAAFCQEIVATVAASEFADDCRAKHEAAADTGLCPRAQIIAGCKLHKKTDDDSLVYDWYYDVSSFDGGLGFESNAGGVNDVARMCADPTRYEEGAELVMP
jgi:hypothetical protein